MSEVMGGEQIKGWTARRKSALILEIIQGKPTVAAASHQFDLIPAEIESWVEDDKWGMENALRCAARVHHSALPAAERDGRARHSDVE